MAAESPSAPGGGAPPIAWPGGKSPIVGSGAGIPGGPGGIPGGPGGIPGGPGGPGGIGGPCSNITCTALLISGEYFSIIDCSALLSAASRSADASIIACSSNEDIGFSLKILIKCKSKTTLDQK